MWHDFLCIVEYMNSCMQVNWHNNENVWCGTLLVPRYSLHEELESMLYCTNECLSRLYLWRLKTCFMLSRWIPSLFIVYINWRVYCWYGLTNLDYCLLYFVVKENLDQQTLILLIGMEVHYIYFHCEIYRTKWFEW